MKCFSLFSGIGGFDLALRNLGHHIVGACEIDKHARRVYETHFQNVPMWFDATKIKPEEIPSFEVLCAGFPCQAFSLAGERFGLDDTRGTLFYEIARLAGQKRPRYLFLENVKGLLYHDEGRTFTTIIKTFYELGYDIEWQVFNSKYFVPQNRDRVFIIGHLREKPSEKIFPIIENNRIDNEPQGTQRQERQQFRENQNLSTTIDASYYKQHQGSGTLVKVNDYIDDPKTGLYFMSHTKGNIKKRYQRRSDTWTLDSSAGTKIGVSTGDNIRRLTPLECERLQGFPDGWTDLGLSDTQRYKCIGNAVTVPVVELIAENFKD